MLAVGLSQRSDRFEHVLASVRCLEVERVQQQRQEPAHGPVAAEQPLAVALLDRPGVLAQLADRLLEPASADPGEDRVAQIGVVDALIEHQRARVREPDPGLIDQPRDLKAAFALACRRAIVDL